MAYSLGDPYRSLRTILRLNGLLLGLLLGATLLLGSPRLLLALGFGAEGGMLGWRIAGVGLIGVGALLLATATRPEIDRGALVATLLFHALLALVLLVGYLRGQVMAVSVIALITLLGVFLLCLMGALAPLAYFGPEYRR